MIKSDHTIKIKKPFIGVIILPMTQPGVSLPSPYIKRIGARWLIHLAPIHFQRNGGLSRADARRAQSLFSHGAILAAVVGGFLRRS